MAVFFTSDTHFGHAAVIRSCERPFASADEMDEALIARWNARIKPGDTVYHLGDFCYRSDRAAPYYLDRLHGEIHLIEGNHDRHTLRHHAGRFASVSLIKEIVVARQMIVLCHYPMREWNGCYRGAWHLHGHVHGRLNHTPLGHSTDVGVDSGDYRPWSFAEIGEALKDCETPFAAGRLHPVVKTIRAPSRPGNPETP
jgi:calcineurin-like phosphoesterase family protein